MILFYASLKGLHGRFKKVEKDNNIDGILEYKEYTTTLNKVRRDLIELVGEYS